MQRDERAESRPTPLGAVGLGLLAGIGGTAAMTAYQEVRSRIQKSGSENGNTSEPPTWKDAPEPAQIGRRIVEGLFSREVSRDKIRVLTNAVHWGYGTACGTLYGLVQSSARPHSALHGIVFGSAVWGSSYVMLPAMKLRKQIWEYPPKTLAADLTSHLVYGLGVAAAYRALEKRS